MLPVRTPAHVGVMEGIVYSEVRILGICSCIGAGRVNIIGFLIEMKAI